VYDMPISGSVNMVIRNRAPLPIFDLIATLVLLSSQLI
jgi:hypothetical protein